MACGVGEESRRRQQVASVRKQAASSDYECSKSKRGEE